MEELNAVLFHLLMAPLPQLILTSAATLIITYTLLRLLRVGDSRIRSGFYIITLLTPLLVYIFFTPKIWIMRPVFTGSLVDGITVVVSRTEEIVSINYVGLICITGLIFGAVTMAISYLFGVSIVKRCQGVMDVTKDDEPRLYDVVEKLSKKIGVPTPKVGLTENLQPNAFTVGCGENSMVIFSSGLLSTLNHAELEAVVAHELAHIKNRDFHIMAIASALKVMAFFNPAAFLSASMLAREREFLADEVGASATQRKGAFKSALTKIASTKIPSSQSILSNLVAGLFVYSQISPFKSAFTTHPSLDTRLDRIGHGRIGTTMDKYKAVIIAAVLVASIAMLSSYIMQPMSLVDMFLGRSPVFASHVMGLRPPPFNDPQFLSVNNALGKPGEAMIYTITPR